MHHVGIDAGCGVRQATKKIKEKAMTNPENACPYVPDEPGTVDLIVRITQCLAGDWMPDLREALEQDRNNSLKSTL